MHYNKIKTGQIVLITHHSHKGKEDEKLIDVFVGEVKSKVKGSKELIKVKNLQKGLGYDPETRSYTGCSVSSGWFLGKPFLQQGDTLQDYDHYHINDATDLDEIIKASNKLHTIIESVKPNRVYTYRPIAYRLSKNCQVEMACLNTQDTNINGVVVRFNSIDRKQRSQWFWCSSFYDLTKVEEFLGEQRDKFLREIGSRKKT